MRAKLHIQLFILSNFFLLLTHSTQTASYSEIYSGACHGVDGYPMDLTFETVDQCMDAVLATEACSNFFFQTRDNVIDHTLTCYCMNSDSTIMDCIPQRNMDGDRIFSINQVCEPLTLHFDCGESDQGEDRTEQTVGSLITCQNECERRAWSGNGCCEWQADEANLRCVWVEHGELTDTAHGDLGRLATMCDGSQCGTLELGKSCGSSETRQEEDEESLGSEDSCEHNCEAHFAKSGTYGCCEWQTDRNRCLYRTPGVVEYKGADDLWRYAGVCGDEAPTDTTAAVGDLKCTCDHPDAGLVDNGYTCKQNDVLVSTGFCPFGEECFFGGEWTYGNFWQACREVSTCGTLEVTWDCGPRNPGDDDEKDIGNVLTCENDCKQIIENMDPPQGGCCEFQTDHELCLFFPDQSPRNLTAADTGRYASTCTFDSETGRTTCSDLEVSKDCNKDTTDMTSIMTLESCQELCEVQGRDNKVGCCEYQSDHNRCIWFDGSEDGTVHNMLYQKPEQDFGRFAAICGTDQIVRSTENPENTEPVTTSAPVVTTEWVNPNPQCNPLEISKDCGPRDTDDGKDRGNLELCQLDCHAYVRDSMLSGCCEWQVDNKRCLFIENDRTEQKSEGDLGRWAAICIDGNCGELELGQDCSDRSAEMEKSIMTLNSCAQICDKEAKNGCCEFQTDHQRCLFFEAGDPGYTETLLDGGNDQGRYQTLCGDDRYIVTSTTTEPVSTIPVDTTQGTSEGPTYGYYEAYRGECHDVSFDLLDVNDLVILDHADCMFEVLARPECAHTFFQYRDDSCKCFDPQATIYDCTLVKDRHEINPYKIFTIEDTCAELNVQHDCGGVGEGPRGETDAMSFLSCQDLCELKAANGDFGCCEYQEDEAQCFWVPGHAPMPSNFTNRYAVDCNSGECSSLLIPGKDCGNRNELEQSRLGNVNTCRQDCEAIFFKSGKAGCCEFQTDHRRCLYREPGLYTELNPGNYGRFAGVCGPPPATNCGALDDTFRCDDRNPEEEYDIGTPESCFNDCKSHGVTKDGCCEWQDELNTCYFIEGVSSLHPLSEDNNRRFSSICSNGQCAPLAAHNYCGPRSVIQDLRVTTKESCQADCESIDVRGCCEYQVDHHRCVYIFSFELIPLDAGDHWRSAAICGEALTTTVQPGTTAPTKTPTHGAEELTLEQYLATTCTTHTDCITKAPSSASVLAKQYYFRCGVDGTCVQDTCQSAGNGVCEDPEAGAQFSGVDLCTPGTDCLDCGRCPSEKCCRPTATGHCTFRDYPEHCDVDDGLCYPFSDCVDCESVDSEDSCRGYLAAVNENASYNSSSSAMTGLLVFLIIFGVGLIAGGLWYYQNSKEGRYGFEELDMSHDVGPPIHSVLGDGPQLDQLRL